MDNLVDDFSYIFDEKTNKYNSNLFGATFGTYLGSCLVNNSEKVVYIILSSALDLEDRLNKKD